MNTVIGLNHHTHHETWTHEYVLRSRAFVGSTRSDGYPGNDLQFVRLSRRAYMDNIDDMRQARSKVHDRAQTWFVQRGYSPPDIIAARMGIILGLGAFWYFMIRTIF